MRCDGNAGIPFLMKQGNGPSSRDKGKMGLFLSCGGTLSVPLKWRRVCRRTLDLHQGCQGHFRGSRGKVGLLSRRCNEKGPHLALRGESPGFSRVAAGNGFLSSYELDLRDPLMLPQESRLHGSCEVPLGITLLCWGPAPVDPG